jgi:hypothetical protein
VIRLHVHGWLLAAAALLSVVSPAAAAGLQLEGRLGLGGRAVFGEHAAVTVKVRLPEGQEPFKGRLRIGASGLQLSGTELRVDLMPGAERQVRLAIPYHRNSIHRAELIEDAGGGGRRVKVELSDDTARVDRQSVVLLASEGWPTLAADDKVTLIHVRPQDLPRDSRVLRGLGALVVPLRAQGREHLTDAGFAKTLRDYASGGGVVVFCGRADAPRVWVGSPLEPLLPVRDPRAASAKPSQVEAFLGAIEVPALPCVQAELAPGARWKERNESLGLLAELTQGAGATRFLAFDPDQRGPRGAQGLPGALRSAVTPSGASLRSSWGRYDLEAGAAFAFAGRPALSLGAFSLIVGVVVLHSLIAVALALVLKRRKRQPWLAVLVPPALSGILGTILILIAAATQDGPEARSLVLVAQPAPGASGPVPARAVVGLFSDRPTQVRVELGSWSSLPAERGALDALQFRVHPPWVHEEGEARWLGPISIPGHGHSRWSFTGEAEGLPFSAAFTEGGFEISSPEELGGRLYGVMVDPQGKVAVQGLESVGPGRSARFDPSQARLVLAPEDADGDPFGEAQSQERLGLYLLSLISARSRGKKGPGFTLVHFGRREVALPGVTSTEDGSPISSQSLVVTFVDLETP